MNEFVIIVRVDDWVKDPVKVKASRRLFEAVRRIVDRSAQPEPVFSGCGVAAKFYKQHERDFSLAGFQVVQ